MNVVLLAITLVALALAGGGSWGQPHGKGAWPPAGMPGMGPAGRQEWVEVPGRLPPPRSQAWRRQLNEVLVAERQSLAQYEADATRFAARMPYRMVIPQEERHIRWLSDLLRAYGLPEAGGTAAVVRSPTLAGAYRLAVRMESDLLPRYQWLIAHAEGRDAVRILEVILAQSRRHRSWFEHALAMGPHGGGWGPGRGMGAW